MKHGLQHLAPRCSSPSLRVVGTAGGTKYGYGKDGKPFLTKEPKLLLNDNNAGKPEGIHFMIGRRRTRRSATRPVTGRCWSTPEPATVCGSRCCCCTTTPKREYAYGPAQGLPASKVGTFTQALYDEAQKKGWTVISMKNDWKKIFAFE